MIRFDEGVKYTKCCDVVSDKRGGVLYDSCCWREERMYRYMVIEMEARGDISFTREK